MLNKDDIKIIYQIFLDSNSLANKNVRFLYILYNSLQFLKK